VFLGPTCVLNPIGISIGSAVSTAHRFTMSRPFPTQSCSFPWGDLDSHLVQCSLSPPEPTTQTASRSVQLFQQGLQQITRSVTIGRIHLRCTANYNKWSKWLPRQRPLGARYRQYLDFVGRPLKPPQSLSFTQSQL